MRPPGWMFDHVLAWLRSNHRGQVGTIKPSRSLGGLGSLTNDQRRALLARGSQRRRVVEGRPGDSTDPLAREPRRPTSTIPIDQPIGPPPGDGPIPGDEGEIPPGDGPTAGARAATEAAAAMMAGSDGSVSPPSEVSIASYDSAGSMIRRPSGEPQLVSATFDGAGTGTVTFNRQIRNWATVTPAKFHITERVSGLLKEDWGGSAVVEIDEFSATVTYLTEGTGMGPPAQTFLDYLAITQAGTNAKDPWGRSASADEQVLI